MSRFRLTWFLPRWPVRPANDNDANAYRSTHRHRQSRETAPLSMMSAIDAEAGIDDTAGAPQACRTGAFMMTAFSSQMLGGGAFNTAPLILAPGMIAPGMTTPRENTAAPAVTATRWSKPAPSKRSVFAQARPRLAYHTPTPSEVL